jgi:RNA-directed DNA polymerase
MPFDVGPVIEKIRRQKVSPAERESLLIRVDHLVAAGLPPMLDISDLAGHANEAPKTVAAMLHAPSQFYREFSIPKRSGGARQILAPFPSLANIQTWIAKAIVGLSPVHHSAVAFRNGMSTKDHVGPHFQQSELFRTDIRDFFPSISVFAVQRLFEQLGYASPMSWFLAQLVTLDSALPQGAPSSPAISNAICFPLDQALSVMCERSNVRYTRYADDFAFSGEVVSKGLIADIENELEDFGFSLNHKKTRHYGEKEKTRFLTGLVITPSKIRPPKEFRRWIRQRIFYLEKYLISDLTQPESVRQKSELLKNAFLLDSLRGKLGYCLWIDPRDKEAAEQLRRLSKIYLKLYE